MKTTTKVFAAVALYFALTSHAHAYLDMGTGNYILQICAAFLVAGLVAVQNFWGKIKSFFQKNKDEE